MKKEEIYQEGRVTVKNSHILNYAELRAILTPGEEVMFFPEDIFGKNIFKKRIKFIRIVTKQNIVCYVPVFSLNFSNEVKNELILIRGLKKSDFLTIHIHNNFLDMENQDQLDLDFCTY